MAASPCNNGAVKLAIALVALEPITQQPAAGRSTPSAADGSGLAYLAVFFLAVTALHVLLSALARRGLIDYRTRDVGRGLGNALVSLSALLQPNVPPPEDRPGAMQLRRQDGRGRPPDPDRAPILFEDGQWPEDGLRTRLSGPPGTSRARSPSQSPGSSRQK